MVQRIHSPFFPNLQLITVLTLICNSYLSWSTWFISLKLYLGFFIFVSVSFLYFVQQKVKTLRRYNCFQNKNNRKTTYSFAPRPLIFKLQQEVSKFIDIYVSWSSPKTDLEPNFLNLKNRSLSTSPFLNSNFWVNT